MVQNTGPSRLTATPVGGGDSDDELLRAVRDAAAGSYDVLGELGRGANGHVIYLARDTRSSVLVALRLEGTNGVYALEVARTLDAGLAHKGASACAHCGGPLPGLGRFCPHCGAEVSDPSLVTGESQSRGDLMDAVREAARGEFEILGEMDRTQGGGTVYFARDVASGRLVTLRLRPEPGPRDATESYSLGVTQVLAPLVSSLGGTTTAPLAPAVAPAPLLAQPTAQRHTPQEVLIPADQLPADETLPVRRTQQVPVWVVVAGTAAAVGALAVAVFVHARLTAPDATQANTVVAPASTGAPAPATARIELVARLPRDARVTVDGIAWRPPTVTLPPGTYTLGAVAPGYTPITETRTLAAGQTLSWSPMLVATRADARRPAERKVAKAPPPAKTHASPAPSSAPVAAAPEPAPTCASAFDAKDWAAASTFCTRDARTGDVTAERNLGVMYQQGHGVAKDPSQAAMWFRKAADAGSRDGAYQLATMYETGRPGGVPKDAQQATEWYRKAAVLGDADAQVKVGMAYENGAGVDVSTSEAVTWYQKAAAQGNAWAENRLGWLYGMGRGVSRDDVRAMKYFLTAADQGDAQAEYNVGFMYANGRGVPRDEAQAIAWFRKAAAQGYPNAQKELKQRGLAQ